MWAIFKVFVEFVTILLLFYALVFFDPKACGIFLFIFLLYSEVRFNIGVMCDLQLDLILQ